MADVTKACTLIQITSCKWFFHILQSQIFMYFFFQMLDQQTNVLLHTVQMLFSELTNWIDECRRTYHGNNSNNINYREVSEDASQSDHPEIAEQSPEAHEPASGTNSVPNAIPWVHKLNCVGHIMTMILIISITEKYLMKSVIQAIVKQLNNTLMQVLSPRHVPNQC